MRSCQRLGLNKALLAGVVCLLLAVPATAQMEYSRLGLSASPDAYVPSIEVSSDEYFTLYVLAKGPDGSNELPFDIASIPWAVFAPCCGASYEIVGIELNPLMEHDGIPFSGVVSSSEICIDENYLVLATITFDIWVEFPGNYLLPAGAIGPAIDCDGNSHFFFDMTVEAVVDGGLTPSNLSTWGEIKAMYQ